MRGRPLTTPSDQSRRRLRRSALVALVTGGLALTAVLPGTTGVAAPTPKPQVSPVSTVHLTAAQRRMQAAGFQLAPKGLAAHGGRVAPNPYLANLADPTRADYAGWKAKMSAAGRQAAASRVRAAASSTVYDEQESVGAVGNNDVLANAETVTGFGTGAGKRNRYRFLGNLAAPPEADEFDTAAEDNGQIDKATPSGLNSTATSRTTSSKIGDGPHGSDGDGSNDFDFVRVRARAGSTLNLSTEGSDFDTVLGLYSARGTLLAANDDSDVDLTSKLAFPVKTTGTYYVAVAGFASSDEDALYPLPDDPFDSGSGFGGGAEGDYDLTLSVVPPDIDYYSFDLKKGDVLGATVRGSADTLTVYKPSGAEMVGATYLDASGLYAPNAPLPGGGNTTIAYVAEESGRYALKVNAVAGSGGGAYDATVEAYRPGSETDTAKRVQTVYLDFDGGRVNTGVWGGLGVSELTPFANFLPQWGITKTQEPRIIAAITATVQENIDTDLRAKGLNDNLAVKVVNSENAPKSLWGKKNVARVVVSGTIDESGISTIGIAQYIDPGNYAHEDQALVLLDVLGDVAEDEASLNHFITPASDRAAFVSHGVGNVISHEIGHLIGNYHTDNENAQHSLMDAGGTNFGNLYGVGRDQIGGTADDEDTDFALDTYIPEEGFTGQENTLNVAAWAFVKGPRATV